MEKNFNKKKMKTIIKESELRNYIRRLIEQVVEEAKYDDDHNTSLGYFPHTYAHSKRNKGYAHYSINRVNQIPTSPGASEAKSKGLVSAGWGRWKDPKTNKIVAKTVGGKLQMLNNEEIVKETKNFNRQ